MIETDVVVIGSGAAGLAAALSAEQQGAKVMILERSEHLGGILPQCIHDGFGNFVFGKMLTGPEYAQIFIDRVASSSITTLCNTMVLDISIDKRVTAVNEQYGLFEIQAKAVILAMGCREKTRNQILLPGTRPAGIYTAGMVQRFVNVEGVMPGKKIVILGSGDVGLIMARRLTLEGAVVEGVFEMMDHPNGLLRNLVQCLYDYEIPLFLSQTVIDIHGRKRLEGVTVAKVDSTFKSIPGTERFIACDCLVLAVGLIPENELSKKIGVLLDDATKGPVVDNTMQTSVDGFFACGNVVQVFDLVDDVTKTAEIAGSSAGRYVQGDFRRERTIAVVAGKNVKSVVPQRIQRELSQKVTVYVRVCKSFEHATISVSQDDRVIKQVKKSIVKPSEMVSFDVSLHGLDESYEDVVIDIREDL